MVAPNVLIENDKYLEYIDYTAINEGFWKEITAAWPGFTADFVFKTTAPPEAFFEAANVRLIEESAEMLVGTERFKEARPPSFPMPLIITRENFEEFSKLHDAANLQMYWTSERLLAKRFDDWYLAVLRGGYVMMSKWGKIAEVYTLEGNDGERAALLASACAHAFESRKHEVCFFIDTCRENCIQTARDLGFAEVGRCKSYRTVL